MADTYVETILTQWGMAELIDLFKEEGIDEEAFKLLDNSTIESLIKKSGLQLKFKSKLKKFHVENWVLHTDASATTDTVSSLSSATASIIGADNSFETPSNIIYIEAAKDVLPFLQMDFHHPLEEPSCKKRKTSVFSSGSLERLLSQSVEGRQILSRKEKGFLDNNLRNKLTHIIISHLLNLDKSINTTTFISVSEEIVDLFGKENIHTYYIPYQSKSTTSPKLAPRGKLYSCYVNLRSAIKIISKRPDSSPVSPLQVGSLPEENVRDTTTLDGNLDFLKNAVEPWDTVLDYWLQTFQLRQSEANLSIEKYFNRYPALKQKQGFSLIEQDFNQLFPGKENILYTAWPELARAIINEATSRRIKLPLQGEEIDTCLLSLIYLPYLFAPVTVCDAKRKKKGWRPSRLEIQESFLLNITNIGLLEEKIEERRGNLLKEKLTLQPFFVCVGEFHQVEGYYVVIDTLRYKVDTPLKALDVTYKAFHTFNAKYPVESAHVWTFIQKMVYDMTTPFDNVNTATHSLISDIKRQLITESQVSVMVPSTDK